MNIRDIITNEANDLRVKASTIMQEAENETNKLGDQADALERKLASLPAEIEELTEEAAVKVWGWIKGEV